MYLVDTNVWIERLLDQSKSEEVCTFRTSMMHTNMLLLKNLI